MHSRQSRDAVIVGVQLQPLLHYQNFVLELIEDMFLIVQVEKWMMMMVHSIDILPLL
jgi:hypothetical protein